MKKLALILTAVVLLVVLTGCSVSVNSSSTNENSETYNGITMTERTVTENGNTTTEVTYTDANGNVMDAETGKAAFEEAKTAAGN